MGEELPSQVVADAGPLIHLHEIGRLRLLDVFDAIHCPAAVWREVEPRVPAARLSETKRVHRHDVGDPAIDATLKILKLTHLHRGELECLTLCRELGLSLLLTDDLAARDAAKALGITPVGSLGIVVRSHRAGLLSLQDAESCLEDLYRFSSLFVTHAIVEFAIEQLRRPD